MVYPVTSPLLDACVLAVISRGDTYGYSLTQEIRRWLDISESTLYPILRRLCKEGCLTVYDRAYQGRNRRYYAITNVGEAMLAGYREAWRDHRVNVEAVLMDTTEGGTRNDQ